MSYCYTDDDTSDPASIPSQHYHHLMPESPLQHKLSANTISTSGHVSRAGSNMSPNSQLEHEKRVRREIANSNERRRMQSINTGFQSLKILIPHSCGEKLSKACILQRAADHIKSLETEKLKLQSQNEQFRILIKSFQIDSTSVLQAQRRLSTNDPDESVLLLNNETKPIVHSDDANEEQLRLYHDAKNRHTFIQNWHDVSQYVQTQKDEQQQQQQQQHYYPPPPPSSSSSSSLYRTTPKQSSASDTTYMIVKQNQPSQRCYKTNSLDQNNDNGIVIVERCQLRAQSVDTNNNNNNHTNSSSSSHLTDHAVSRRNLQTIVEAIRHLEGDDALANINPQQSSANTEDLPAQIKAMINEKFHQQQSNKSPPSSSANTIYQQTINIYDQQHTTSTLHDVDLHQKPPKKRKITYNENDDTIEQQTIIQKHELPPISSPDVHHHEQISSESSPPPPPPSSQTMISNLVVHSPPTVDQLLQEHLIHRSLRYPPPALLSTNIHRHPQP